MKAFLKNYRQSPRKVRLVADLVKGKDVAQAIVSLDFLVKRAGEPIKKLIISAVSNAKQVGADEANLFVKDITVDKGLVMKRMMPRAMGRGARINKRTSHVTVLLGVRTPKVKKLKSEKNVEVKKTVTAGRVKKVSTKVKNK